MSLARKSLKQLLLNYLRAFVVDEPNLLNENQSYQPGIHLQIGWKNRQKLASPSSGGFRREENRGVQIHLKLIGVGQLTNPYLGCLREPRENSYVPAMEQRRAQFTSPLITLCKSANALRKC